MSEQEILSVKKSVRKRLLAPSPKFFKILIAWMMSIGGILGGVAAYILQLNPNSKIGLFLASFSGFLMVVAPLIAKLPIDENKLK